MGFYCGDRVSRMEISSFISYRILRDYVYKRSIKFKENDVILKINEVFKRVLVVFVVGKRVL